jgi:hypothetical protein
MLWDNDDLYLQKMKANGSWEADEELAALVGEQGFHIDLVIDRQDTPHWTHDDGFAITIDGDAGYDSGFYPDLAIGPNGELVVVWIDVPTGESYRRLFSASTDIVQTTKRYYANDQQLAFRVDDALYYTLSDPSGVSYFITDETGTYTGTLLYDGYGGVLSSTLSPTMTAQLVNQGGLPDPDTGLVYLGGGQFYDPTLGRALQPDPVGGPLIVPQSLNRYGVSTLGPVGVAEASFRMLAGAPSKLFNEPSQWIATVADLTDLISLAARDTPGSCDSMCGAKGSHSNAGRAFAT